MKGWENFRAGDRARKDPEKQWQGKVNRKNGETLERFILDACAVLRENGIADIEKTPEPFKVLTGMHRLKSGGMGFEGVFAKKAQPDFKGTLKGGRAIVFEAKSTEADRIAQDCVTQEQTESLSRHFSLGAETFVIVGFGMRDFYRVPWGVWESMKEIFGHKYMNREEIERFRIGYWNGEIDILRMNE